MLTFALLVSAAMTGQSAVPVEREPQHKPVFENAVVRLLDVVLPPGYVSLFHIHSNDNVSVRLATGPTRVDLPDTDGQVSVPPVGRVLFNAAAPPYTHRVVNTGTTPIHILDIEILASRPAAPSPAPPALPRHTLEIDHARVRSHRVTVSAGESLAAHTHPRAWLEVIIEGAGAGQYRWHEPGTTAAAAAGPAEIVEIEVQ